MIQIALDIATMVMLVCVAAGGLVFHRRVSRLREALLEAGTILPRLDEAMERMNRASNGFSGRIQGEMQAIEGRLAGVKRLASDLSGCNTEAEALLARLDGQLRQAKRLDTARSKAVPRELAEPKGFAERMGLERMGQVTPTETVEALPALPAPPAPVARRREKMSVLSISLAPASPVA